MNRQTSTEQDICPISKSIEAVFVSKSEARQLRTPGQKRNTCYQNETLRPIVCLAFVLPWLLVYELGSVWLVQISLRSGIDQWFHQSLYQFGLRGLFILPMVTITVLMVWHHQKKDHWKIRPIYLVGMLTEAIGLGLILFWAAHAINQLVGGTTIAAVPNIVNTMDGWWANIIACLGSGIYEELIFRMGLLSALVFFARRLIPSSTSAHVVGVIVVSFLFAILHYNGVSFFGNQFELSSFAFRFFASIVFCILFLFRGFGIAVGAHVAYDVLTQV